MKSKGKNILSLIMVIIPFYFVSISQKIIFTKEEILVESYLGIYMLLAIIGILTILLLNRYLLNNTIKIFRIDSSKLLLELVLAGLILISFYFIQSIEDISYGKYFSAELDRTVVDALLNKIFNNVLFSIIIIGPFTWLNEIFVALSVAFILINFWELSPVKSIVFLSILVTSLLVALLQIDNGIAQMINSFIIISLGAYIFYKYKSILPLLIAAILHQSIELIAYWVYM